MKRINILLFSLLFSNSFSQEIVEKEIKSEVNDVTVFIDGAQVIRKKTVDLLPGITILKFVNLSPFIDPKSVQVKANGEVTVLSVNHQQNFIDKSIKSKELVDLDVKEKDISSKIELENIYLEIIKEELLFLKENRNIGGKDQVVSTTSLREISEFYSAKLTSLKLKEIERNKAILDLTRQKTDIENQILALSNKKEYPTGEVLVKIDVRKATKAFFEVSYVVSNASWFPTYDIRAKNINEPVLLFYKANVRQDTKEDWKDVRLRFSSTNPNSSGVAPELKPYFLSYNSLPPVYNRNVNMVKGRVFDSNKEPLLGAYVKVPGTTIGAITDMNGEYSITLPNNAGNLSFSLIGFQPQTLPVTGSQLDVVLAEDVLSLNEVEVLRYGNERKTDIAGAIQGMVSGVSIQSKVKSGSSGLNSLTLPLMQIEKQIMVDFEIKTPYTIKSDNKGYSIDMEVLNLPAQYKYYCVPKIDKDAFLLAYITDWEKYNLLEGEANVFFEDTYVGKTLLDVRSAKDTLQISLGRDKNVSVNRQKIKDFVSKQFIGTKKEETRAWLATIKNNKSEKIDMVLLDQVPVSTSEEIEVDIQNISGAQHSAENGEIKWEFSLQPNDKKDFELRYSVKYPKNKNLVIE